MSLIPSHPPGPNPTAKTVKKMSPRLLNTVSTWIWAPRPHQRMDLEQLGGLGAQTHMEIVLRKRVFIFLFVFVVGLGPGGWDGVKPIGKGCYSSVGRACICNRKDRSSIPRGYHFSNSLFSIMKTSDNHQSLQYMYATTSNNQCSFPSREPEPQSST